MSEQCHIVYHLSFLETRMSSYNFIFISFNVCYYYNDFKRKYF